MFSWEKKKEKEAPIVCKNIYIQEERSCGSRRRKKCVTSQKKKLGGKKRLTNSFFKNDTVDCNCNYWVGMVIVVLVAAAAAVVGSNPELAVVEEVVVVVYNKVVFVAVACNKTIVTVAVIVEIDNECLCTERRCTPFRLFDFSFLSHFPLLCHFCLFSDRTFYTGQLFLFSKTMASSTVLWSHLFFCCCCCYLPCLSLNGGHACPECQPSQC